MRNGEDRKKQSNGKHRPLHCMREFAIPIKIVLVTPGPERAGQSLGREHSKKDTWMLPKAHPSCCQILTLVNNSYLLAFCAYGGTDGLGREFNFLSIKACVEQLLGKNTRELRQVFNSQSFMRMTTFNGQCL